MKIAITGKGGVGKTTLSGVLARLYAASGEKVLAIDADPDANLASSIGFPPELLSKIVPVAEMEDLIEERTGMRPGTIGGYFKMNPKVDDLPDSLSAEWKGIKLLLMGTVKKGGGGCVCAENVLIKQLVRHVVLQREEVLILDMEAGIEHLGRGTAEAVDALIVVVEPGSRSIQTAQAIKKLAADLGLKNVVAVGNKVRGESDREFIRQSLGEIEVIGFMDYDEVVMQADLQGISPYDLDGCVTAQVKEIQGALSSRFGGR